VPPRTKFTVSKLRIAVLDGTATVVEEPCCERTEHHEKFGVDNHGDPLMRCRRCDLAYVSD
jgi:hypothetical protein